MGDDSGWGEKSGLVMENRPKLEMCVLGTKGVGFNGKGHDFRRDTWLLRSRRDWGTPGTTKELPQKGTKRHEEGAIGFCIRVERLIGRGLGWELLGTKGPARGSSVGQMFPGRRGEAARGIYAPIPVRKFPYGSLLCSSSWRVSCERRGIKR